MNLESPAFQNGGTIPGKYAHMRENVSPPLRWTGVPQGAKSLALVMDDPDASSVPFVHWLIFDIPADVTQLPEGASRNAPGGARQGKNNFGDTGYDGPQPPGGTHRYYFHLYALDEKIDLPPGATRPQLDRAMHGHILAQTELMGQFSHR